MVAEVYLNGKFIGEIESPQEFVQTIRTERRRGTVVNTVNVYFDDVMNQVFVECGKGRTRRPLIMVKDGMPLLTEKHLKQLQKGEFKWSDLVNQGVIEFLDAAEEENSLIAFSEKELTPEHTHLEITPLGMMGLTTGLVPYGNF